MTEEGRTNTTIETMMQIFECVVCSNLPCHDNLYKLLKHTRTSSTNFLNLKDLDVLLFAQMR